MTVRLRLAGALRQRSAAARLLVLAVLAYLPALTAAPGKLPADTKLFLYLDPGALVRDAPFSWDTGQFGGWVPHQTIAYLWPSGPWFWLFERLGVPDWVAHRLWIGTLLFAAGAGVCWVAGKLGLTPVASLVAALVYQLSPYVLPYISRTSVLLLPWAAVGWITGLTVRAANPTATDHRADVDVDVPRSRADRWRARAIVWRDPALIALVVVTVGAVNFTALLMIVPAPVLWLVHVAWARAVSWRHALATAARIGVTCLAVSLWWIAMLVVQGRYGADVLDYSELISTTSLTSSSTEVLRGLGYWLFYVRDPYGFTTTASIPYTQSTRVLLAGALLLVVALVGLTLVRWAHRRFAAMLLLTGVVLAVSVHPLDDPSLLTRPLADSKLLLALRSSSRAVPLSGFALALGAGALVSATLSLRARRTPVWRHAVPLSIAVLAVVNLPALWDGGFVDPALEHDQHPPAAWQQAAQELQAGSHEFRVVQLPGQESPSFRWGYTVDPPIAGLTDKPLLTRDWLPLGSPGAMDLFYAFDDRFQDLTIDPAAIAPIVRVLAADTIWLANDEAFEHFRTARPEQVAALFATVPDGLGVPTSFGAPAADAPRLPMVDEAALAIPAIGQALAPVQLVAVDRPVPVIRASTRLVLLQGSGDGLIDAAAAHLIAGDEAVIYAADAASVEDQDAAAALGSPAVVIITDSDRDRAHAWRSSQDAVGFTEAGGADGGVLRVDDADQRLPVFDDATREQTTATLDGGLVVRASAYGEPFAYRPEDRPAMAVDGDLASAWIVGDRGDPIGEHLEVSTTDGRLTLVQPQSATANRMITRIQVEPAGGAGRGNAVELDESSLQPTGQVVDVPSGIPIRITIEAIGPRAGSDPGPSGVGFADLGLGTHKEVVRVPTGVLADVGPSTPVALVLTRLRADPLDRWRSDPEPTMIRAFTLPVRHEVTAAITVRLARRAPDDVLAGLAGVTTAVADRRLTGDPGAAGRFAVDGDPATAWTSPFGEVNRSQLTIPLTGSLTGPLTIRQPLDGRHSTITSLELRVGDTFTDVSVPAPDADGVSTMDLPALTGDQLVLTVTSIEPAITIDRRYGEPTVLPVSISELTATGVAPEVATAPPAECRTDLVTLDGRPLGIRIDANAMRELLAGGAADVQACDPSAIELVAGEHRIESAPGLATGIDIDRVALVEPAATLPATASNGAVDVTTERTRTTRTAEVAACPSGCWLIFGEGFNPGWSARSGGRDLGPPTQISGGFNGWWLTPSAQPTTVHLVWEPQTTVNVALAASVVAVLLCLSIVVVARRRREGARSVEPPVVHAGASAPTFVAALRERASSRGSVVAAFVLVVLSVLLIAPVYGLIALLPAGMLILTRRRWLIGATAVVIAGTLGIITVLRQRSERFRADLAWPDHFEDLHRPGMFVVVLVLCAAVPAIIAPDDGDPAPEERDESV